MDIRFYFLCVNSGQSMVLFTVLVEDHCPLVCQKYWLKFMLRNTPKKVLGYGDHEGRALGVGWSVRLHNGSFYHIVGRRRRTDVCFVKVSWKL